METKEQMLDRHARENSQTQERHAKELAELDSRWWEEWFTENPLSSWVRYPYRIDEWLREELPTIIRKRDKIGVTIGRRPLTHPNPGEHYISEETIGYSHLWGEVAIKLAGRTLAPGERVEL